MLSMRNITRIALTIGAIFAIGSVPSTATAENGWPPKTLKQLPNAAETSGKKENQDLVARVHKLERNSGQLVTLTWSIENNGGSPVDTIGKFINDKYKYKSHAQDLSGVSLTDRKEKVRFQPLMDTEKKCLCLHVGNPHEYNISKNDNFFGYASFFVPKDTKKVSVNIKGFPEMKNVAVK